MDNPDVCPLLLSVHPIYGAIYQDGEFVQRGAILGLSVDARDVVIAPVSGWVHISSPIDAAEGIGVRIDEATWEEAEQAAVRAHR